uniref:pentatricopeptide repeat-containing protein At4g26680, mitochondrial n=1 Tax=Erigeron canadensis TaxID=72917 RepID=UPI001CB8A9FE|nr:pentatricopeptide repeat-containing protein At4g26680, mitochondrial [Erigeron canadensis]
MNFVQIRQFSTLLHLPLKNPKSPVFNINPKSPVSRRSQIPIPHKTIQQAKGQDLDYINIAHSHLIHSDYTKLITLLPKFSPFTIKHILLKFQENYSVSLHFYKWVETHNPNLLTLETHSIMLHILTKYRKFVSAEYVLKKIVGCTCSSKLLDAVLCSYRLCDSTPRVFDAVFKMYAQVKMFRNVSDTFCLMREYGFVPTIESCNLFMSSLLSLNRADVVLLFYKEMRRSRIDVNVFTLNMVINGYCQLGKLENAVRVFDEMKDMGFSPFVSSYNTLIAAYVNQGLLTTGMDLKVTMEKNGISADVITYNTLIHGFCKEGKMKDAYKLFNEMNRANVAPNTVTFNTLISGYCKAGKTEKGNQVFEEMMRNGFKADILTYNALLLGLCNEGKTRKAAYLVQELDKKKLVPNASTFAALIRGQCVRRNPERGFQLYKSMRKSGCRPIVDTVKMLMSSFVQNDDYDGVFCLFKEMLERPIGPDSVILTELCKGFSQVWRDRLVMSLSKEVEDGYLVLERYERIKKIVSESDVGDKKIKQNM